MKTEVVSVRYLADVLEELEIRERVKSNGTIKELRIRFYPGQEKALRIMPYVIHKNNRREDLVTYAKWTESFFSGDDDYFIIPCSVDVEYDDEIAIHFQNMNNTFQYTVSVDVVVNYFESGEESVNGE